MSDSCDGVTNTEIKKPNLALERSQDREPNDDTNPQDFALKTPFRGFEKKPAVLVKRADITPYLRNMTTAPGHSLSPSTSLDAGYSSNVKLPIGFKFGNCSVKVLNDDLFKLKAQLISQAYDMLPYITCRICKKQYPDEKKLRNHQSTKHMIVYQAKPQKRVSFSDHVIVHEVKEYHKCRKCTRIFEDYILLKTHMKKDHKKRKCYICHYCTKSFVDRSIFKVHIKLHCNVCAELLPNKAKYIEHRRNTCRVIKLHHCRTCNEAFFKFMDLKDHSYEHLSTNFICDICKDQFETKCAVAHHIAFLHSERRPVSLFEMRNLGVDRLYLCNFCDESSVDKDLIETHVESLPDLSNKAMTGYKDYYFCDQCLKKFDRENDMLQHKWTHFLKTSDNGERQTKKTASESKEENEKRPNGVIEEKETNYETKTYNVNTELPLNFQPIVILKRLDPKVLEKQKPCEETGIVNFVDIDRLDDNEYLVHEGFVLKNRLLNKPIVDPKSKKTLMSKHQCPHCHKYLYNAFCLRRHIQTVHLDLENLRCKVCEETFYWPSLLLNHRCLRASEPDLPFEDARHEIHFDNLNAELTSTQELDDLCLNDENPMHYVDFEVPAPVVQLTEFENSYVIPSNGIPNQNCGGFIQTNGANCGVTQVNSSIFPLNVMGGAVNGGVQFSSPLSGVLNSNGFLENNILRQDNLNVTGDKTSKAPVKNNNVAYKIVVQEVPIEF